MRLTVALLLTSFLTAASAAAQNSNGCVYPISLKSGTDTFQFCLTSVGTLAQLGNALDSANPMEGFVIADEFFPQPDYTVPGLGLTDSGGGLISQPNGPGTLPMTFGYSGPRGNDIYSTVTASAAAKTVTFTMKVPVFYCLCDDWPGPDSWSGVIVRAASLSGGAGSSNFDVLASGPFGYNRGGSGLSLQGSFAQAKRTNKLKTWALEAPNWTTIDWFSLGAWGDGASTLPFVDEGTLASGVWLNAFAVSKTTFTYKLF